MRLRSAPILGCVTICVTLAMMDVKCDYKDALGGGLLDGLWYAAALNASNQGDGQLQSELDQLEGDVNQLQDNVDQIGQGQPGIDGINGLSCWDLNGNGDPDPDEDINGDGVWDALDCKGADGTDGTNGGDGTNGINGTNGTDGADGGNCWDDIHDFNQDGVEDSYDCLDYAMAGGEDAVIASGVVDNFGVLVNGTNIDSAAWVANGEFRVVVDLADSKADLTDATLVSEHFPVLLTAYATSSDPLPGSDNISAIVAHYKFDPDALDRDNKKLTVRVLTLEARTGEFRSPDKFSIMVLEP